MDIEAGQGAMMSIYEREYMDGVLEDKGYRPGGR